jgi:hypothetical protein
VGFAARGGVGVGIGPEYENEDANHSPTENETDTLERQSGFGCAARIVARWRL